MEQVIEELKALTEGTKPEWPTIPANKWLARSAMQKAIRRGRTTEAWSCADVLFNDDKAYAWRALSTCIVEDVGLGDVDLLAYSTLITLSTVTNKMPSPKKLFFALIERACKSVKTRSACELSLGAEKDLTIDWNEFRHRATEDLIETMFSTAMAPTLYAATSVVRSRCRSDQSGALLQTVLNRVMEAVTDPALARATMLSFERNVDTMNLSIWPLVARKMFENPTPAVQPDVMPVEVMIGGVSSAAFDMHTQQGKSAIKALHTSLCKKGVVEFQALSGLKGTDVIRALGSIVFILEGGQIDRRLVSIRLNALKQYQDQNFARAYGVPGALYESLLKIVGENFEALNAKRVWAYSL